MEAAHVYEKEQLLSFCEALFDVFPLFHYGNNASTFYDLRMRDRTAQIYKLMGLEMPEDEKKIQVDEELKKESAANWEAMKNALAPEGFRLVVGKRRRKKKRVGSV